MQQTRVYKLAAILGLAIITDSSCACATPATDLLSPVQMEESLDYVEQTLSSAHVGSVDGFPARAEAGLRRARLEIANPQTAESFYFTLNRFLQNFDDAHTLVRWQEADTERYEHINLPVAWNESGIFFIQDTADFNRGERIHRMGPLDESELLARLREVIPAENNGYLMAQAASLLNRADYLRMLEIVNANNSVVIEVSDTNGSLRQASTQLITASSNQTGQSQVSYQVWPQDSLAVLRFDRFDYNEQLAHGMEAFFQDVKEQDIRKVAVDLRNNPGGDSAVAFAFLEHFSDIDYRSFSVDIRVSEELDTLAPHFAIAAMNPVLEQFGQPPIPENASHYRLDQNVVKAIVLSRLVLVPPDKMVKVSGKQIYLLTNALTFSSGNLFTILVKDNKLGQIIGEPTGNRVGFNGSELHFDIPHTRLYLNLSTARMIRPGPSQGDADSIVPDVYIPLTPDAVVAGTDSLLEYLKTQ
jgi:hypothetical protein